MKLSKKGQERLPSPTGTGHGHGGHSKSVNLLPFYTEFDAAQIVKGRNIKFKGTRRVETEEDEKPNQPENPYSLPIPPPPKPGKFRMTEL